MRATVISNNGSKVLVQIRGPRTEQMDCGGNAPYVQQVLQWKVGQKVEVVRKTNSPYLYPAP